MARMQGVRLWNTRDAQSGKPDRYWGREPDNLRLFPRTTDVKPLGDLFCRTVIVLVGLRL